MAAGPARHGCAEWVNRESRESVDRGVSRSLTWTDDAKSLVPGKRSLAGGRSVWLRRCGEEARAGPRSGTGAGAGKDGHRHGANRNGVATAPAEEFFGEADGFAAAACAGRQNILDRTCRGKVCLGRTELQSGTPGSGAAGF